MSSAVNKMLKNIYTKFTWEKGDNSIHPAKVVFLLYSWLLEVIFKKCWPRKTSVALVTALLF